jgi:hypothetical protein
MAIRTHDSSWRFMLAFAPLLGLTFVVGAALQEGREILESPIAMAILGAVAALGALVAWWTRYQLRAVVTTSVALAKPGQVSLHGLARALPGAPPLMSPDDQPCLWFYHRETIGGRLSAWDSVRPFLLVDGSGQCVVLPAGASISGGDNTGTRERRLHQDEEIHVTGQFVPASAEAIDAQQQAAMLAAQAERQHLVVHHKDEAEFRRMSAHGPPPMPAPPPSGAPLNLPVLTRPGGAQPFIISIGSKQGEGGYYELAAIVDTLVLLAACGAYWLLTTGT